MIEERYNELIRQIAAAIATSTEELTADIEAEFAKLPSMLQKEPGINSFISWYRWTEKKQDGSERATKIPCSPGGNLADVWREIPAKKENTVPFIQAYLYSRLLNGTKPTIIHREGQTAGRRTAAEGGGYGVVFSNSGLSGIDIDHCISDDGELSRNALDLMYSLDSYTEYSPSGKGLHILVALSAPDGMKLNKNKLTAKKLLEEYGDNFEPKFPEQEIEFYTDGRYFTFTGNHLTDTPDDIAAPGTMEVLDSLGFTFIPKEETATGERQNNSIPKLSSVLELSPVQDDNSIIERMTRYSRKAADLFTGHGGDDDSSNDLALCNSISFYTTDPEQIDRIFRQSGLYREKWERRDYRERTIKQALSSRSAAEGERRRAGYFMERMEKERQRAQRAAAMPSREAVADTIAGYDKSSIATRGAAELFHNLQAVGRDDEAETLRNRAADLNAKTAFNKNVERIEREERKAEKAAKKEEERQQNTERRQRIESQPAAAVGVLPEAPALKLAGWTIDKAGVYKAMPDGSRVYAAKAPVLPTRIYKAIEYGKTDQIEIHFKEGGISHAVTIPRETLSTRSKISTLSGYGLNVDSEIARNTVTFFTDLLQFNAETIPTQKYITHLGWYKDSFILPEKSEGAALLPDVDGTQDYVSYFETAGDFEEWRKTIATARRKSLVTRLILAAAFGSVLLERCNAQMFFVHLLGRSGIGKTKGLQIAASVWGNPGENDRLIMAANSTQNAIEAKLHAGKNLPLFIDEVAQRGRGKGRLNVLELANGRGRNRAAKNGNIIPAKTWNNIIISTAEGSLFQENAAAGEFNRAIEIPLTEPIFDRETLKNVLDCIDRNHGHAGREFLKVLPQREELAAMHRQIISDLYNSPAMLGKSDKQIPAAAVLLLADKLAAGIFKDELPEIKPGDIAPYLKDEEDINTAQRAWNFVTAEIISNLKTHFAITKDGISNPYVVEHWGTAEDNGDEYDIYIMCPKLTELFNRGDSAYSFAAVYDEWEKCGYLVRGNKAQGKAQAIAKDFRVTHWVNGLSVKTYHLRIKK